MMKVYAINDKIDPCLNPFVGQQLVNADDAAMFERLPIARIQEDYPIANIEMADV